MRILGIDPGLNITGYGCVETARDQVQPQLVEAGVFRLKSKTDVSFRLAQLYDDLTSVLESLQPNVLAVETLFTSYRHPRTSILMGHARGVLLLCGQQFGLDLYEFSATEVKKSITGNGHASKLQMQNAIQHLFDLAELPSPPDVADAIAIACTAANRMLTTVV